MLFNSIDFALFLLLVLGIYPALSHRLQNLFLLLASYFFYACWSVSFLSLIWLSTFIDYACSHKIAKAISPRTRRFYLGVSLVSNLGILGFFKYYHFFAENLAQLSLAWFGLTLPLWTLHYALPVGISFYTFQTMSYTLDVYRGTLQPCKSVIDFSLFVAFFPQLVAGPIERASTLLPQITQKRFQSRSQWVEGGWLIYWGLFKKIYVADNLAVFVNRVFPNPGNGVEVLVATYAFAFQILCDFSGYSDIARGVSKLLGFELCINFNNPYFATNPSDFWRRWHISLSTWLRDYLYISLGGNRFGARRLYFALMMTMLLGGFWHGANWTFILWGFYHGVLLILFRVFSWSWTPSLRLGAYLWFFWRVFFFFHLTCFGWLIFRAETLTHFLDLLFWMWDGFYFRDFSTYTSYLGYLVLLVFYQIFSYRLDNDLWILEAPAWFRALWYSALYLSMAVYSPYGSQQFIYFQF
jgi:alginate O-acetyltransferase complex protein AlgI